MGTSHYSFVVDWFINVGDVILANTYHVTDSAKTRKFCVSTKVDTIESWKHVQDELISLTKSYSRGDVTYEESLQSQALLKTVTTRTYNREIFEPRDIDLTFNVRLSLLQSLDGIALLVKPLLKQFRSLRR
jgi:hypothetical protein